MGRNKNILNNFTKMNDVVEMVSFSIIEDTCKYIICAIYRPPSSSAVDFNRFLFRDIFPNFPHNARIILAGDINYNLFNPYNLT